MNSESPNSDPRTEAKKREKQSTYQELIPYLTLGIQLAAAVVVFYFIGDWIDTKYGIAPIGKLVGATIGMVGGFINFLKSVTKLIANEERNRTSKKHEN